jgi:hypothetical protein
MKTWAYVNNGLLQEIIEPMVYPDEHPDWVEGQPMRTGLEIPIEERRTSEYIAACVDITGVEPQPQLGWVYVNDVFSEPVPYVPTAAEVVKQNSAIRDTLLSQASLAIAPLQYAVDLGEATTEETASLQKWKQYSVAVNRLDLTVVDLSWPAAPTTA